MHLRFGAPLTFPRVEEPSPSLASEVTERIWPCVELQWEWLGGLPPLRTAAVVGAGSMGTARRGRARARRARGPARLPHAGAGRARRAPSARTPATCRASSSTAAIQRQHRRRASSSPASTSSCSPCPAQRCPPRSARSARAMRASARPCWSPRRASCRRSARRRRRTCPSACGRAPWPRSAGPAHAREAVEQGASVVVATRDPDLRRQLGDVLDGGRPAASTPPTT